MRLLSNAFRTHGGSAGEDGGAARVRGLGPLGGARRRPWPGRQRLAPHYRASRGRTDARQARRTARAQPDPQLPDAGGHPNGDASGQQAGEPGARGQRLQVGLPKFMILLGIKLKNRIRS